MTDHPSSYAEAVEFLFSLQWFGTKLGLENTLRLAESAGSPHKGLRFIHVAGTNGKGSVCAMLESVYRAQGMRVGLFTSPHLLSFCERIQIGRHPIPQEKVAALADQLRPLLAAFPVSQHPTFFEVVTVMALLYFQEQQCDLVIWETGMGGRLDATNIVTPLASVITNIQYDHQKWLGHSLAEIAMEKAGILKQGVPAFTSAEGEGLEVIVSESKRRPAPLTCVTSLYAETLLERFHLSPGLTGPHQRLNAALALATILALRQSIPVSDQCMRVGMEGVRWPGRFQIIQNASQTLVLDGAHNPAGIRALTAALNQKYPGCRPSFILGVLQDKDYMEMAQLLAATASCLIVCPVKSPRTASPEGVISSLRAKVGMTSLSVGASLSSALQTVAQTPLVVITGSLFFIGEALELLQGSGASSQERGLNEWNASNSPPNIVIPSAPLRGVSFDAAFTLLQPHPSVGHVYSRVLGENGFETPDPAQVNLAFAAAWRARGPAFDYSEAHWFRVVQQALKEAVPRALEETLFRKFYDTFRDTACWLVYEDVRPALDYLRAKNIPMVITSNWDNRLRPLLADLKLHHYFRELIISGEVGFHKPDKKIFELSCQKLGFPPSNILHVGDSLEEDLHGAQKAGLQAQLIDRSLSSESQGAWTSLEKLRDYLGVG